MLSRAATASSSGSINSHTQIDKTRENSARPSLASNAEASDLNVSLNPSDRLDWARELRDTAPRTPTLQAQKYSNTKEFPSRTQEQSEDKPGLPPDAYVEHMIDPFEHSLLQLDKLQNSRNETDLKTFLDPTRIVASAATAGIEAALEAERRQAQRERELAVEIVNVVANIKEAYARWQGAAQAGKAVDPFDISKYLTGGVTFKDIQGKI
jgi:hypothetical protein